MPIKCGGAPQKIMYLSEETWRTNGVRSKTDIHFHTSMGNLFPNCEKFADALKPIAEDKGITTHFKQYLKSVDKEQRTATFVDTASGEEVQTVNWDFIHITPPQSSPDFVAQSALAAGNGFVDVDSATLRHNKYDNVFSCGDVANLPTAKTAAGVFGQAPVLVNNLLKAMEGKTLNEEYDGYQSCPLFTGDKKLMLIEFKYGGESAETFGEQTAPRWLWFFLKRNVFPVMYMEFMPRGEWYGRNGFRKPVFK